MYNNSTSHYSRKSLILLVAIFLLCVSPSQLRGETLVVEEADSLLQAFNRLDEEEKLTAYPSFIESLYATNDLELQLRHVDAYIKASQRQKDIEAEGHARMLKMTIYTNYFDRDTFFKEMEEHVTFWKKHGLWRYYFNMLHEKIRMLMAIGSLHSVLEEANAMYEFATDNGLTYGVAVAKLALGSGYVVNERLSEGEEILREAVRELEDVDSELIFRAYYMLFVAVADSFKDEEIVPLLEDWERALIKFEQKNKGKDCSHEWFSFYIEAAYGYGCVKEFDVAREYLQKAESGARGQTDIGKGAILTSRANLYYMEGKLDESLEIIDSLYLFRLANGDVTGALPMLQNKATVAYEAGKYQLASDSYLKLMNQKDSLRRVEVDAKIDELKTVYEVDKLTLEKERNYTYFILALVGCLLMLVILTGWFFYSRKISLKNRNLVQQIKDSSEVSEELERRTDELYRLREMLQPESIETEAKEENELLVKLKGLMSSTNLYIDSSLNRRTVADKLGTNEKYLHDVIRKELNMGFSEYLTSLRLAHARKMLSDSQKATIEAIALDSGFGSRQTFYRVFRQKYDLTPEEYRKFVKNPEA
ncbi:helix-turn-helix domain-containing protein [Bacteroides sp. OttesenSCG-928-F21]|nr:helix-turn-helix domain-containing protein [Bacteroides sp. OttesenSCG-928-F21]